MTTVMICADNSRHSDYAIDFYISCIHKQGNSVRVVHCPEHWQNTGPMEGPSPGRLQELRQEARANTAAISEKCLERLHRQGVPAEFVELSGKEPWEAICCEAKKCGASLIVIGTRGQGTFRRTVLGSVSDSVLHHAECPVLVCRHKEAQQQQQQQH